MRRRSEDIDQLFRVIAEALRNAKLGACRGSGVLLREGKAGWRVAQYNLQMAIPNGVALDVAALAAGAGGEDS